MLHRFAGRLPLTVQLPLSIPLPPALSPPPYTNQHTPSAAASVAVAALQDQARISGALFVLRFLARKYEFRGGSDEEGDERAPLEAIVNATFPVLLQIFQVWVGGSGSGSGSGSVLKWGD